MSFRIHRALIFSILVASSLLLVHAPQAAAATISIPITVKGLSPQLSTTVIIDGSQQGTIPGGGTKNFNVDKSKTHTIEVEPEIKGSCASYDGRSVCSRYMNDNNVWTLDVVSTQNCQTVPVCYDYYYYCDEFGNCWYEPYCTYEQQCWTTTELAEKGHVFAYSVEQEVVVSDTHGRNTDTWEKVDADVNLSADQFVVTRDESNVKERDVFVAWMVNGAPMESRTLTLKADKPLFIRAEYRTETQFRIGVSSDFGNPTMDNRDGWYMGGQEATVSVEKEVPSEGLMGSLGGKNVFVAWRSGSGVESKDPTYAFVVKEPTNLQAEWRNDDSQPMTILGALIAIIALVLVIFALYMTGRLFKPKPPSPPTEAKAEPTELEKAKAEIETLKEELEEAKRRPAKKEKAEPKEEPT